MRISRGLGIVGAITGLLLLPGCTAIENLTAATPVTRCDRSREQAECFTDLPRYSRPTTIPYTTEQSSEQAMPVQVRLSIRTGSARVRIGDSDRHREYDVRAGQPVTVTVRVTPHRTTRNDEEGKFWITTVPDGEAEGFRAQVSYPA